MSLLRTALIVFSISAFPLIATAQDISGNTTIDIDVSTGQVTVTCETDLDGSAQANYQAFLHCQVQDSSGAIIAYGNASDASTGGGVAQVVLTFSGVPGVTYTATGRHSGIALIS